MMKNYLNWHRWSLAVRLTLTMIVLVVLAVVSVTLLSLRREQETFQNELEQQAELALNVMEESSANALYNLDVDSIEQIVLEFENTGFVARVYDADGRLVAETQQDNPLRFGLEPDPFAQDVLTDDDITYDWESDKLVAAQPVKIGRDSVGVASVEFSTETLNQKIQDTQERGLLVAGVAVIVGTILALIISRTITGALTELSNAAGGIAKGDWSHQVRPHGGRELVQVGKAFNTMTAQLRQREEQLMEEVQERKRAEQAALAANQMKSMFLANMSHELRTPLNAIIGFTDVMLLGMLGDPLTDRQRDQMTRVRDNSVRLLALINDILDLSRIEAGRVELVKKPVDVPKLVHNISAQMQSLATQKNLTFTTTLAPDVPATILADEKRLEQIIVNLLSNAFKFTKVGSISLNVQRKDSVWQIAVSDTGIGIPVHAQDKIFDAFQQVDGSSTREYGGTGLGLAITRDLVRLMDGQIQVQSKRNEGTTFTVTLPLADATVKQGGL